MWFLTKRLFANRLIVVSSCLMVMACNGNNGSSGGPNTSGLSCQDIDGQTFRSKTVTPEDGSFMLGHTFLSFDGGTTTAQLNGDETTGTYRCNDGQLHLTFENQDEQLAPLSPLGFSSYIDNIGQQDFEYTQKGSETCFLPHGRAYQATQTIGSNDFETLSFYAFDSKVDVQKGTSIEVYNADCVADELHLHKVMNDDQPLVAAILREDSFSEPQSFTFTPGGVAYEQAGSFNSCLDKPMEAVCAERTTGAYTLFPNMCFATQVAAVAVSDTLCNND